MQLDFDAFHRLLPQKHPLSEVASYHSQSPILSLCGSSVSFRTFRLQLKPDAAGFSEDFTVVTEKGSTSADLSHIYSGTLQGVCRGEPSKTLVFTLLVSFRQNIKVKVFCRWFHLYCPMHLLAFIFYDRLLLTQTVH